MAQRTLDTDTKLVNFDLFMGFVNNNKSLEYCQPYSLQSGSWHIEFICCGYQSGGFLRGYPRVR